ncbi:atrial natriuretic peptide receptor 1-like [Paramacrobiotus metropolitanus]|uniref:atrial natriuretic peptide receptor 1-like n=1 Tax=Paramacrobiotus metropolitanus TaxID=2943436 RepID=UPI002446017A|nr:atrial natriuretic peptide receptor 1-like [Paramacrobiotus metropolitanus]
MDVSINITILSFMVNSRNFFPGIPYTAPAFQVAVDEVNADGRINMTLVLLTRTDLVACEDLIKNWYMVPEYYYTKWSGKGTLVLSLSGCEENAELRILAREWNILLVGTTLNGNNPLLYPTVVSFTPGDAVPLSTTFVSLFDHFGWTNIVVLHDSNGVLNPLQAMFQEKLKVILRQISPGKANQYNFLFLQANSTGVVPYEEMLLRVKPISRIVCLLFPAKIVRMFLIVADRLQMTNAEYVYIMGEPFRSVRRWGILTPTLGDGYDMIARNAFPSLLQITGDCENGTNRDMLAVMRLIRERGVARYNALYDAEEEPNPMTMAAYFAVKSLAQVFLENMPNDGGAYSGKQMAAKFYNRTFRFPGTTVYIGNDGMRRTPYCTKAYNASTESFQVVSKHYGLQMALVANRSFTWRMSDNRPPSNVPACGYSGDAGICLEEVKSKRNLLMLVILALGGLLLLLVIRIWQIRKRAFLNRNWWHLDSAAVTCQLYGVATHTISKIVAWNSLEFVPLGASEVVKNAEHEQYGRSGLMTMQSSQRRAYFCKGQQVAVKEIPALRPVARDTLAQQRLHQLRSVKSENLVRTIGILDGKASWIFVTEFMPRGTMAFFMEKSSVDTELRLTLLYDLLKGVSAIHASPFLRHGYLSPNACFIDRHFTLKLECGLYDITKNSANFEHSPAETTTSRFIAPELVDYLLLCRVSWMLTKHALPHHDMYAIGGLIHWTLDFPQNVKPPLTELVMVDRLRALATLCQSVDGSERPRIGEVVPVYRDITLVQDEKLIETLLKKMETYNGKLEQIVHERTLELRREQALSMELLREMLPKVVVQQLVCGLPVQAELFQRTSVSFAIVWGFAEFCANVSPGDIVHLLNIIFTMFDGCLKNADAYKVETISDCYVTASGLPTANGNRHAMEICRLALDLRQCFLCIPRLDHGSGLQLKIGVHSGPCAAGVVGNKRPRYCLFGTTVNVASRLAYSAETRRIQIGGATARHAGNWPTLRVIPRGMTFVRGVGNMKTFWLERGEGNP